MKEKVKRLGNQTRNNRVILTAKIKGAKTVKNTKVKDKRGEKAKESLRMKSYDLLAF